MKAKSQRIESLRENSRRDYISGADYAIGLDYTRLHKGPSERHRRRASAGRREAAPTGLARSRRGTPALRNAAKRAGRTALRSVTAVTALCGAGGLQYGGVVGGFGQGPPHGGTRESSEARLPEKAVWLQGLKPLFSSGLECRS